MKSEEQIIKELEKALTEQITPMCIDCLYEMNVTPADSHYPQKGKCSNI